MKVFAAFLLVLVFSQMGTRGDVVAEYKAGVDPQNPAAIGWKEIKTDGGVFGPQGIGAACGPAWRIGDEKSHVNRVVYRWRLEPDHFQFRPWLARATVCIAAASSEKARDAFLEVQDGISEWTIVFAKDHLMEGVGFLDKDNQWQPLYEGDISSKPIDIEMTYDPAGDALSISINGVSLPKTIGRDEVARCPVKSRYYISWGDGASAAHPPKSPSETCWRSVKFETKQ